MTVSQDAILYAIENSIFELPISPAYGETLHFPQLRGRQITEGTHPMFDTVGASQLTQDNASETIDAVIEHFSNLNKTFGWVVGPLSTPDDLPDLLEKKGLTQIAQFAGMVLRDMATPIKTNPRITVRKATAADADDLNYLYEHGYPLPGALVPAMMQMMKESGSIDYLAFLDGVERPISVATMFAFPGHPILMLQGAATLEEYRGNGAYSALVAQRLADGRATGLEVAILQGDRTTSAPICAKLGFEEVCSFDLWAWGLDAHAH
jgi:hypothetical protein